MTQKPSISHHYSSFIDLWHSFDNNNTQKTIRFDPLLTLLTCHLFIDFFARTHVIISVDKFHRTGSVEKGLLVCRIWIVFFFLKKNFLELRHSHGATRTLDEWALPSLFRIWGDLRAALGSPGDLEQAQGQDKVTSGWSLPGASSQEILSSPVGFERTKHCLQASSLYLCATKLTPSCLLDMIVPAARSSRSDFLFPVSNGWKSISV